jgi:long-chain acyl-CoA synthetase
MITRPMFHTPTRPFPWETTYPPGLSWDLSPPGGTITDLMDSAATTHGDALFLDYRDARITFTQFRAQVENLGAGLLRLDLPPGDKIALYLPNCPYHPFAFFAVLKAGYTVVHLSPLDAERELIHKLHDSGATTLITTNLPPMFPLAQKLLAEGQIARLIVGDDAAFGASPGQPIPEDRAGVINIADLLTAPTPKIWPALQPDALAVLQYTGGTTGLPKAAIHTHANMRAAVAIYHQFYTSQNDNPEGQERVIAVLPFFHIYGLVVLLLWQMQRGATLFLHPRFDPQAVLHDIEVKRATYFPGVPTMWIALNALPGIATRDFSSLRQISSGGAPLPQEVAHRFEAMAGRRIGGGWGMTETAAAGTSHLMKGLFNPNSVGVPLPGVQVQIVSLDDPAKILGPNEKGEIAIRGPNIFKGYWQNPEDTQRAFTESGFFLTGDIGMLDEHGLMHLIDRKKDMIISGGFNVYPTVVEAAIYEHEAVEECIVIGVADAYRGQAAKAYVKLRDGTAPFSLENLHEFLETRIGRYEMPSALEFRDTLPKTPVGKLSKIALIAEPSTK